MGIIEGVAEAATWPQGQLDLHQWSAAMHELKIAPPIAELLTPTQFYGHHSRTAYTLCGSFSRFVYDTEGETVLWDAYKTDLFDADVDETRRREARWREFLKTVHVPERALTEARAKFDRPSNLLAGCAPEKSLNYGQITDEKWDVMTPSQAIEVLKGHIPRNLGARQALAKLHIGQEKYEDATELALGIVQGTDSGGTARSTAQETLGDIAALPGDHDRARQIYEALDEEGFKISTARTGHQAGSRARNCWSDYP